MNGDDEDASPEFQNLTVFPVAATWSGNVFQLRTIGKFLVHHGSRRGHTFVVNLNIYRGFVLAA